MPLRCQIFLPHYYLSLLEVFSIFLRILLVRSPEFCSWISEAAIKSEEMSWEKRVRCVDTYVILWHCNTFKMEMVYSFERGEAFFLEN